MRSHLLPQMHKINNPTLQNVLNLGPFIHMGEDVRPQARVNLGFLNYSQAKKVEVAPSVCSVCAAGSLQWEMVWACYVAGW